jgi:hypothetical protein
MGLLALLFVGACRAAPAANRPPAAPKRSTGASAPSTTPSVPPAKASRPRGPAYRVDNGLGSPIA